MGDSCDTPRDKSQPKSSNPIMNLGGFRTDGQEESVNHITPPVKNPALSVEIGQENVDHRLEVGMGETQAEVPVEAFEVGGGDR